MFYASRMAMCRDLIPKIAYDNHTLEFYYTGNASATFDPTITTSQATNIVWQPDDGAVTQTTGTTHAYSYVPTSGSHRCKATVVGGLGLITVIDSENDFISRILNINRCSALISAVYEDSLLGNALYPETEKTWVTPSYLKDYVYAQKFTSIAGTIGDIRIRMPGNRTLKVAIYDDDGASNYPGTLLAYSVETACITGINIIQLNAQVALSGDCWLAFKISENNTLSAIATGGTVRYAASTYADAFPNPMSSTGNGASDFAIAGWGLRAV